jgi:multidrug resistance efflux pump
MKQDRISKRMMKLAKISRLTREDVSLNLDEARGNFSSSKSKVEEAQARLDELQKEFEELQENFGQARSTLLELNHLAQVMDLTGAEETRDRKGQRTFMIGGKEHEVDASDVNDIRCTPYSRKKEEDEDSNATDDVKKEKSFSPDVSLADDPDLAFASDIIESTAKLRFR